jgi:uncharacterized protein (DUF3084 family)
MQISKKMLIPMAAVAVIGAGIYGTAQVSAATNTTDPHGSLIQKLADTFHVDKSKVQAVFDQNRAENQASREKNYEDRLTQAVTDGKITSAQKDAILAENKKLKAEMETAKNDATADRKTAMDKIRTEAKDWATQNNIDEKWLMGGMGGHPRGGMGGHGMMGNPASTTAN